MFGTPRLGWKPLAELCRRLATSFHAGLDARRVLERESQLGRPWHRQQMRRVQAAVDQGESLSDAFRTGSHYFPNFFIEMIHVGERTGKLDHILTPLAEYYEHLVTMRRIFLIGIAWPALQFVLALLVVGILIFALGVVGKMTGETTDILGFGLVGTRGLVRYFSGLGAIAAAAVLLFHFLTSSRFGQLIYQQLLRLPGLGPALRVQSLFRLAWSLGLALDSGADARLSVDLALKSSQNRYFTQHAAAIDRDLRQGREMHEALAATAAFPSEFIEALALGEESGKVSESLLRLAKTYQEQAQVVSRGLTWFAMGVVWLLVAGVIITLIFRIFSFYLGVLHDAMEM